MTLVKMNKIIPAKDTFVYAELRVHKTAFKKYKPYISQHNSDETRNIQKIKAERKKKNNKDYRTTTENKIYKNRQKRLKGYYLLRGDILKTYIYNDLISISWNGDYAGIKKSLSVELPVSHEKLKHLYKGVECTLHLARLKENQSVKSLRRKENLNKRKSTRKRRYILKKQKKPADKMIRDSVYLPFRTDFKNVFTGYIEEIDVTADKMSVKIAGASKALEQEDMMTFRGMKRSDILKEVIKSAGMTPMIDTTGLIDEKINWSTTKDKSNESTSHKALFGKDCTSTYNMSVTHSGRHGNAGTGKDWDHQAQKGYAQKDTNYYKWATQFKNGEAMLIQLRKFWKYKFYRDNRTCPQKLFNTNHFLSNCGDAARLVKVCCDSIGFPCVVIHGSIYAGGHYWNCIKIKGTWKTFDLCYAYRRGDSGGTNTSNLF